MTTAQLIPSVSIIDNRPATTSLDIAEHFGKRHDSVLRDIRRISLEVPEIFRLHNFVETSYRNSQDMEQPMFTVFFDGFILLVMGYTGKKALNMKLAYIAAFNAMREQLENQSLQKMQQLPASDAPLTPDQQCTLKAMVRALVERGGHYAAIWSRFNNHFRIARYCQLSQSRMSEAVDYLMRFEVAPKALPGPELPVQAFRGTFPRDMKEARKDALKRIVKLSEEARIGFTIVHNIVAVNCSAGGISSRAPDMEHDVCNVLDGLQATASASLAAAYNALESAYRIGRCYGRG